MPTSVSIKTNNKLDCQLYNNDLMVVKRPGGRTKDMRNHQTARACRSAHPRLVTVPGPGVLPWGQNMGGHLLIPSTSWVFP